MTQVSAVDVLPRVLRVRLNLGSSAAFSEVATQMRALEALTGLVEGMTTPYLSPDGARTFLREYVPRALREPLVLQLSELSRYGDMPSERLVSMLGLFELNYGTEPTPKELDALSALALAWRTERVDYRLKLERFTYENPVEGWIGFGNAALDTVTWGAHASAALLLLRGLMWNIRSWQSSGRQLQLQDLEIAAKRLDLQDREAASARRAQTEWELRATAELVGLVRQALASASEETADPAAAQVLDDLGKRPANALRTADPRELAAALAALVSLTEVVDAEIEE